jgi:hypothetical protein
MLWKERRGFEFTLRNRGAETLQIGEILRTCGCTAVEPAHRELAPGESTVLTGTILGGRAPGPFDHQIVVVAKGKDVYRVRCSILGELKRRITFSPEKVVLKPAFLADQPDVKVVTLHNGSEQSVIVRQLDKLPPGIAAHVEPPVIAPNGSSQVTIKAQSSAVTPAEFDLRVRCTHRVETLITIPVEVLPTQPVEVTPEEIHLGVLCSRELQSVKSVGLVVRGDLLAGSDVDHVAAPPYLLLNSNPTDSGEGKDLSARQFRFDLRHERAQTDLGGEIVVAFRHRQSGRLFEIRTRLSGFLTDPGAFNIGE